MFSGDNEERGGSERGCGRWWPSWESESVKGRFLSVEKQVWQRSESSHQWIGLS